ncbi:uncharacterized protein G2W53_041513 [Senna tora]|uniref:Retrotransposon gag domain-containing protein n=1 Tax=Senna tora TaxID=362788 RepID=A0A834VYU8_9FABA|nr:uncharacterized protein G2W53_041513 [Senna tora]
MYRLKNLKMKRISCLPNRRSRPPKGKTAHSKREDRAPKKRKKQKNLKWKNMLGRHKNAPIHAKSVKMHLKNGPTRASEVPSLEELKYTQEQEEILKTRQQDQKALNLKEIKKLVFLAKKKRVVETSSPPVHGRKRRGRAISHSRVRSPISPSSLESTHSEEAEMAEQNNRNVSDYAIPKLDGLQHSIWRPSIQANNFEIKPATIQLLQANGQFGGSPIEDPNNHILNFLEICDTFKHNGVSDDAIRLRLFPFSLRDQAKVWLQSLPEGSISTWEELAQQFLTKYFPPGKTAKMRNDITSFVLLDNESLYEAWERFNELLRKCPHHGLPKWLQVQTFYNGLSSEIRTSIDAAAGGALMSKPVYAAYTLLEKMSSNNYQWHSDRHVHARVAGVQDSDMFASLSSQIVVLTKENQGAGPSSSSRPNNPLGFNIGGFNQQARALPPPAEKKPSLEEMMMSYMSKNDALMQTDRSIVYPRGVIEDVLVKVDKFIFPADFIVLDYEEDREVPIILGRPFLATGRTIIDVQKGELKMRVQQEEVTFNVFKAMKLPGEPEECFRVNMIESSINSAVREVMIKTHPVDPLEAAIMSMLEHDEDYICDYVKMLDLRPIIEAY